MPALAPARPLAPHLSVVLDDEQMLEAVVGGRPQAAAQFWEHYSPLVRGLLRRALGPGQQDVEDLLQDVFLRLFEGLKTVRDPAALRGFVVVVTMNAARTHLRKQRVRRWLRLTDEGELPERAGPGSPVEARAALHRLYALLDQLGAQTRLVYVLHHIEQLDLAATAQGLGMSLATTKRRLAKACAWMEQAAARDAALAPYLSGASTRPSAGGTP